MSKSKKFALLGEALLLSLASAGDALHDPADEARFVVDAVIRAPIPKPYPVGFDEKAAWVTNLFLRLDGKRP